MTNRSIKKEVIKTILGAVMLVAGFVLLQLFKSPTGLLVPLPYFLIGYGAGIFGGGLGVLLQNLALQKDKEAAKRVAIEEKDERNLAIAFRAKAKAYDIMMIVFGALIFVMGFMQIQLYVLLTLVGVYLLYIFLMIYYLGRYQKEM